MSVKNAPSGSIWVYAILLLLGGRTCGGYRFELGPYAKKCLFEELPNGIDVAVEYTVAQGSPATEVSFTIWRQGQKVYGDSPLAEHGKHSFVSAKTFSNRVDAPVSSQYDFCFSSSAEPGQPNGARRRSLRQVHREEDETMKRKIFLRVSWGVNARDYSHLAMDRHMDSLNRSFVQVADRLNEILLEIDHVRRREAIIFQRNEETSRHVLGAIFVSSLGLLAAAGAQLYGLGRTLRQIKAI